MAEQSRSFPMLPVAHWWALRKKFRQSIPGVVTDTYLASVLDMQVASARANVLPFLKTLRIVDGDGKTLERAKLWRDDHHYPEVCKAILKETYPQELLDMVSGVSTDRAQIERWFSNHTGSGQAAVNRMVALFNVLVEADASKQTDQSGKKAKPTKEPKPKKLTVTPTPSSQPPTHSSAGSAPQGLSATPPGININLQIHISADASSDQIDQIFASMAKHIYKST